MIIEGVKLAVIGMLVVFMFLIFLVLVIHVFTSLLKPFTEREEREAMIRKRKTVPDSAMAEGKIMAIITAAVAAHRGRMKISAPR